MARGDNKWFAAFVQKAFDGTAFDLNSGDILKLGLITNALTPTTITADPRWGPGGATDFSTAQVALATAYTGPITLTNVVFTRTANVLKLDFDDLSVASDALGPTNIYYGIILNYTVTGQFCIGCIDLGGPISIRTVALDIDLDPGGFGTHTFSL